MSTMQEFAATKGTTILAFVLDDAIIAGYDSRGTKLTEKNIVKDDVEKFFETKGVCVTISGHAISAKGVFDVIKSWAEGQGTENVKISQAAEVAEKYVMEREWTKHTTFAVLIMGMENGRPLVFAQKNCDLENPKEKEPVGSLACKKQHIKDKIALGSGSRHVKEEMEKYNRNMPKDEGRNLAALIMLKASLFDARTGGKNYVDYINNDGRVSMNWVVPRLYLERFSECADWDTKTVFLLFVGNRESAVRNELVQKWMITDFPFIGEDDLLSSHIIGGFHEELLRKVILWRVVFRKEQTVNELFKLAKYNAVAKEYHLKWNGYKVHLRNPSEKVLKYLLCDEKKPMPA